MLIGISARVLRTSSPLGNVVLQFFKINERFLLLRTCGAAAAKIPAT